MNLRPVRVVLDTAADTDRRHALLAALLEDGFAVTSTASETPGEGHSEMSDSGATRVAPLDQSPLLVLRDGALPEAPEAKAEGVPVAWRSIDGLDSDGVCELARDEASASGLAALGLPPASGAAAATGSSPAQADSHWQPWFPVIDYDRCTNCMQCLSFCLFGVYDVDSEQQIDVANPQKCKTNCPACSRVCPEVAILFPKYKNGPINGDVVKNEDIQREKMKTDITSLLGGDIYALLRQRHERANTRFSKERDEERALKERQRCLNKLQEAFDIPDEVLKELPTAEAIQNRAAERIARRQEAPSKSAPSESAPSDPESNPTPRRSS